MIEILTWKSILRVMSRFFTHYSANASIMNMLHDVNMNGHEHERTASIVKLIGGYERLSNLDTWDNVSPMT
jgi:hypothetical protein